LTADQPGIVMIFRFALLLTTEMTLFQRLTMTCTSSVSLEPRRLMEK